MKIPGSVKISYKNLMSAKLRSFLTILGVVIGIASVILVMAIGQSAQRLLLDQVSGIGSNLIGIIPGASEEKGPPASVFGVVTTTLTYEDLRSILKKNNVPNLSEASGYVSGIGTLKSRSVSLETNYQGVSSSMILIENFNLESGRFFSFEEETSLDRVIVLGNNRARELFPSEDPVGKKVTLNNLSFTVAGVVEKRGSVAFSSPDDLVYVPLFTAQKTLLGIDYLNFIRARVDSPENVSRAISDVRLTIRNNHRIQNPEDEDFSVRDAAQAISVLTGVTDVLRYFLASIAAISLLVGGVGIMNIMLISVNQRIREVGLRKALGATDRDVSRQFLSESVFIALVGGVAGIFLGTFLAGLAALIISSLGYSWEFVVTWQSIALSVSVSAFLGLLFGSYPARRAAAISPLEALRHE